MIRILLLAIIGSIADALIPNTPAYYIQTDEGPNRFFQFSSGPGGQFRRETLLPNGTVVGAYSWRDSRGMTRIYSYMADRRGYRVTQHRAMKTASQADRSDNPISNDIGSNTIPDDDDDVGRFRNSKKLRLRRKVLVKRQKSARQARLPKSVVGVKKLGLGAEIIPYQPTLLLSSQYPGRKDEMRLVGDEGIITININNKGDPQTDQTMVSVKENKETEGELPTSVLLQRVRVSPGNSLGGPVETEEKDKKTRRRGKFVRRRRRKRGRSGGALKDNVYFTPL